MNTIEFKYSDNEDENKQNILQLYNIFKLLGYNDEQSKFIISCIIYNNLIRYKYNPYKINIRCIKYEELPNIYKENINRQIKFDTYIFEENNNDIKLKLIHTYKLNDINADFILNDETKISFIIDINNDLLTNFNKKEIINKCLKYNDNKDYIEKIINDIVDLTIKYKKYPKNTTKFIISIYKSCIL